MKKYLFGLCLSIVCACSFAQSTMGYTAYKETYNQWESQRVCFDGNKCIWRASTIGNNSYDRDFVLLQLDFDENNPKNFSGQFLEIMSEKLMNQDLPSEIPGFCEIYIDSKLIKKSRLSIQIRKDVKAVTYNFPKGVINNSLLNKLKAGNFLEIKLFLDKQAASVYFDLAGSTVAINRSKNNAAKAYYIRHPEKLPLPKKQPKKEQMPQEVFL